MGTWWELCLAASVPIIYDWTAGIALRKLLRPFLRRCSRALGSASSGSSSCFGAPAELSCEHCERGSAAFRRKGIIVHKLPGADPAHSTKGRAWRPPRALLWYALVLVSQSGGSAPASGYINSTGFSRVNCTIKILLQQR